MRRSNVPRFALFVLVGGLNTLVGYSLFAAFVLLGMGPTLALAAATILGVLFNFRSFGLIVFRNGDTRLLPRFILFYVVQFAINLGCLRWLISTALPPIIAQLIILPPLSVASFLLMRRLVFGVPSGARVPQ